MLQAPPPGTHTCTAATLPSLQGCGHTYERFGDEYTLYGISGGDVTELSLLQVGNTRVHETGNPVEASFLPIPSAGTEPDLEPISQSLRVARPPWVGLQGHGKRTLTFPLRSEHGASMGQLAGGETTSAGPLAQAQGGPTGTCTHLHTPGKYSLA